MAGRHHEQRSKVRGAIEIATIIVSALLAIGLLWPHRHHTQNIAPSIRPIQTRSHPASIPVELSSPLQTPPVRYVVQVGDNLYTIAYKFHIADVNRFYQANISAVGTNWDLIHPGQVLRLTIGK